MPLNSTIYSDEMEERILDAFEASDHFNHKEEYQADYEHGQWFITCLGTGRQWSVVDASGGQSIDGFDFELVSADDDT